MAEGLLGGILGEQDEKPEVEAPDAIAGAEAFAAAVAAIASRQDPQVARDTSAFLHDQSELLKIQKKHLEDEHAARLHFLQGQAREVDLRRFGLRLRVGFQLFTVLVATLIGLGSAVMIRDAVTSRSVVVDRFEAPASLAEMGLTGRVIAAAVHDRLVELQAATRIAAQKRAISGAWANEIGIEVPEVGVSISQLERALRVRFGHDQHISGDLVKTGSVGFALTVRGAGVLPKTFADAKGDLNALVTKAAEYVYGESQPGSFAHYLANDVARYDDTVAFAKSHLAAASIDDQPLLLNYWANAVAVSSPDGSGDRQALPLFQEAVRINPEYWNGYDNIGNSLAILGDEERALQTGLQLIKVAGGRPGKAPESAYLTYDLLTYNLGASRASQLSSIASTGGGVNQAGYGAAGLGVALTDIQLHEVETARLRLTTAVWNPQNHLDVGWITYSRALIAEEVRDLTAAATSWDDYALVYADRSVAIGNPWSLCWAAPTYEKTAQPVKADAALAAPLKVSGASTYVDCYRFKGDVLDLRGNWAGAQQWYAKAVKLAPSIPSGYYSWGLALAKRGDLDGAAEKFKDANRRGPHWADPLKAWGDVMVKQGNTKEALVKYVEALKYAPNWKELKEARESLAKHAS
jgi:tetratricopeptide (TPR) repeat protein